MCPTCATDGTPSYQDRETEGCHRERHGSGTNNERKARRDNSKEASKRPCGKIYEEIRERDGILIKGKQVVVLKTFKAQAITLDHEGHMLAD